MRNSDDEFDNKNLSSSIPNTNYGKLGQDGQGRSVEVYGHYSKPRVKWTCPACGRRNDMALTLPIANIELKFCKFCRKRFSIAFTRKDERANK